MYVALISRIKFDTGERLIELNFDQVHIKLSSSLVLLAQTEYTDGIWLHVAQRVWYCYIAMHRAIWNMEINTFHQVLSVLFVLLVTYDVLGQLQRIFRLIMVFWKLREAAIES